MVGCPIHPPMDDDGAEFYGPEKQNILAQIESKETEARKADRLPSKKLKNAIQQNLARGNCHHDTPSTDLLGQILVLLVYSEATDVQ